MKKVFLFMGLLGLITSCSVDDDNRQQFRYEVVPVEDVTLPDSLVLGQTYEIPVSFVKPTACYYFEGFDYQRQDSTRYVAVVNRVLDDTACADTDVTTDPTEEILDFEVLYTYDYVFKFYQGNDSNDEPIYLTKVVPVKH
ncbi:MAG: hypothetical protein V7767_12915 [Leeuwenhoekiella sp.]